MSEYPGPYHDHPQARPPAGNPGREATPGSGGPLFAITLVTLVMLFAVYLMNEQPKDSSVAMVDKQIEGTTRVIEKSLTGLEKAADAIDEATESATEAAEEANPADSSGGGESPVGGGDSKN